ncbi:general secretion pathway protein GspF [Cellvibrio sp. KY-GH-1]|uniref:general secretion pathway protein GspF n=1 Tax=Cellvibrio sp. KY-GH-1 TaxID=2303332 RepID=UPI0012464475|nr:general secretion pathway protein GspF [Cellvibrio sp. KY-GH-1]QEY17051.1 general secretion pathway protein GspF [Cellvibrio sp. KY-GH-1]
MTKKTTLHPDAPLLLNNHRRPVTRRELVAQGFRAGTATVLGGSIFSLFANPREAEAALSADLIAMRSACGIAAQGAGKIPFICFDLAGGANIAGSNVLIGQRGGQLDFLSAGGYSKLGLPAAMSPAASTAANPLINTELGLAFHSTSAMLRGILEKVTVGNRALTNGAVIPARSENDTGNNPHNPMYGINKAGANGSLLALIGSRASDSGGNSMAPAMMINPEVRPTKVDNPNDVTGLVDVGDLVSLLDQQDTVAVMESIYRISDKKLGQVNTGTLNDAVIKDMVRCGYVKSADLADRFGNPSAIDPVADTDLVGATGVFSQAEFDSDGEFRKTASVAKLVVNGYAGAGTITMGGYDYHTGDRSTGESRDLRAGRCIGACLEYAAKKGMPVMIYVFSDGSVFSNGMIDDSAMGGGKGVWTGDDQQTGAAFFLVYNPARRAVLVGGSATDPAAISDVQRMHQQLGQMRPSGDVETGSGVGAANNVNSLVETVILNYLALHGQQNQFGTLFPGNSLGNAAALDKITAFAPICNGVISQPV